MKVKTSSLTGVALDWAVAKCGCAPVGSFLDGIVAHQSYANYHPSADWSQGGPIIENEGISVEYCRAEFKSEWIAYKLGLPDEDSPQGGPTPLIAAMRTYVASKLGDEVEIPGELL